MTDLDALAIEIKNNPKLKEISWKVTRFESTKPLQILFYNNPLFDPKTIDLTVFDERKNNNSYIQAVVNGIIPLNLVTVSHFQNVYSKIRSIPLSILFLHRICWMFARSSREI